MRKHRSFLVILKVRVIYGVAVAVGGSTAVG
jgi:hypothetical protein